MNQNPRQKTAAASPGSIADRISGLFARRSVHLALIALAALAAYAGTFSVPFQFDDIKFIVENPVIRSLGNFLSSMTAYQYNPRRFVANLTFALNYRFGGYDVAGYHVVNLAIHVINGMLVYALVLLCFRSVNARTGSEAALPAGDGDGPAIALFAALFFVVHPVQTQAVTYIYQRIASLATLFFLLSVTAYAAARLRSGLRAGGLYLASAAAALLAMKTKEIAFTLPFVIVAYEFIFFGGGFRKKALFVVPVLLLLAVVPLSVIGSGKSLGMLLSDLDARSRLYTAMPRWDYLMTELRVITTYVRLLFLPVGQNLDYDYPLSHSLFEPAVFASLLFLVSIAGLGVYFLKKAAAVEAGPAAARYRVAAFGIFWFFITLSVESSIIPIVDVIFEHRVYLPSAGAFTAIAASAFIAAHAAGSSRPKIRAALIAAFGCVVVVLIGVSLARNAVWADPVSLWQDVVAKSPAKARGYNNLGNAYNRLGMLDKADEAYRTAMSLGQGNDETHNDLGIAYLKSGKFAEAIEEFDRAMELNPKSGKPHNNLGIVYGQIGQLDKAIEEFSRSIALDPGQVDAYRNRGFAYFSKKDFRRALGDYQIACGRGSKASCEDAGKLGMNQ